MKLQGKYASKLDRHRQKWVTEEKAKLHQERQERLAKIDQENKEIFNQLLSGEKVGSFDFVLFFLIAFLMCYFNNVVFRLFPITAFGLHL